MTIKQPYEVGLHNVGSFQVAGVPYLTGAVMQEASATRVVTFPYVTNRVIILRLDASGSAGDFGKSLDISFTHPNQGNTSGGLHKWRLAGSDPDDPSNRIEMRVKCKELYITTNSDAGASWQLYAELTNIPVHRMYALTGSGLTD